MAVDPTGGLWTGLMGGNLANLRDGKAETHRVAPDDASLVNQLPAEVEMTIDFCS